MELPALNGECLLHVAFFRLNSRAGAETFLSTSMTPCVYLVYSRDSENAYGWTEGLMDRQMNGWISYNPVFLKSSPSYPLAPKPQTSVIASLLPPTNGPHLWGRSGMISGVVQMVVRQHRCQNPCDMRWWPPLSLPEGTPHQSNTCYGQLPTKASTIPFADGSWFPTC